jgi:hypothetical protein
MSSLSRSARNRAARNARASGTVPRGTIQNNRPAVLPPADAGIRAVGYLGRNRTSVKYAGSGQQGYRSEWAMRGHDFFTDPRWDRTVSG